MLEIPAGTFTMGTKDDLQVLFKEPVHEVKLTRAFYLADREVTVEEFERFNDDAEYPVSERPENWEFALKQVKQASPTLDCPVQTVSWYDAVLYCNWLSTREGRRACYQRTGQKEKLNLGTQESLQEVWRCDFSADGYRLPTEAEWEYACRGGSGGAFCFGDDSRLLKKYAWFSLNAGGPGGPHPCEELLPNAWGLFDMHGNVFEWCCDRYGEYSTQANTDPTGPAAGTARVVRGGAFINEASNCRSAYRAISQPVIRIGFFGFCVSCGR